MKEEEARKLIEAFFEADAQGKTIYMDADQVDEALDWLEDERYLDDYYRLLEVGLRLHPDYIPLLVRRCFQLIYEEKYKEAYDLATSLENSRNYEVYAVQIDSLFCLEEPEKALRLLEQRVEENCEDLDLLFADVADFLIQYKMLMASREVLKRGFELFPDSPDLKDEFNDFIALACELPQAMQICKDLVDAHPYTSEGWSMLGKLQVAAKEYNKALESFDFAALCGGDAEDPEIKMLRAYCHYMNDNQEEAIKLFEELREMPELRERVVPILAECYLRCQKYQESYTLLRQFIDQATDTIEISVLLNFHTCCLALKHWDEAESILELASELYSTNSIVLHRLVIAAVERNDLEDAVAQADRLFQSVAEDSYHMVMSENGHEEAKALFSQAMHLYKERDYDGALLCFRKAYETFPAMRIIEFFMAITYLKKKDIESYLNHTRYISPEEIETILDNWFLEKGNHLNSEPQAEFEHLSPSALVKAYLRNKSNRN